MKALKHIFLCALTLGCLNSISQEIDYRNYTKKDGLPSNEIYHVLEDSKGYLWFSTDRGVSRFDGREFENFTTENGLVDNTVFLCHEDDQGRIWFLSYSPLLCYYENNAIHHFQFNKNIEKLQLERDPKITAASDKNRLFIGTCSDGYYEINLEGKVKVSKSGAYLSLTKTAAGHICYGEKFYPQVQLLQPKYLFLEQEYYPEIISQGGACFRFAIGKNKTIVSDGTVVYFLRNDTISKNKLVFKDHMVISIYEDDQGLLWLGFVEGGVKCFDISGQEISLKKKILSNHSVSFISKDGDGGMWFTTLGSGAFYSPPGTQFKQVAKKLPNIKVQDILIKSPNQAFVSYINGSIWLISDSGRVQQVDSFKNPLHFGGYNPLGFIYEDNLLVTKPIANKLLAAENQKVIDQINLARNLKYKNRLIKFNIISIKSNSAGGIWIGTNAGLYYFKDRVLEKIINPAYFYKGNIKNSLRRTIVEAFHITPDSTVYISTLQGLCEVKNDKLLSLAADHALLNERFDDIVQFDDSTVIAASRGHGVILWNGKTATSIGVLDGLSNNLVNTVCVDKNNFIWAGTNNGLNRIKLNPNSKPEIQHFTTSHGLHSNQITKLKLDEHVLWVGTSKGLFKLDLNSISINKAAPKMLIERVRINDQDTSNINEFVLDYNQNRVQFHFLGIAYKGGGNLTYKYQLQGLDEHWNTTINREAGYASLPPGSYTFKVKAANEDGVWSPVSSINFKILPPLIFRWWFILIQLVLIFSIILFIIKRREARIREKSVLQKKSAEMELKALRAQMNPHFTFNTLGSIQQFILKNSPVKANDYLSQFAKLIRNVLENSSLQRIALKSELETLELYLNLEKLRLGNKLNFKISVDPNIHLSLSKIPPLLVQPFVENAIVHGISHKNEIGFLSVEFFKRPTGLNCIVTDDGVGRKKSREINSNGIEKKKSFGIKITRERLALLKTSENENCEIAITDLEDFNRQQTGTRVEIFIPNTVAYD